MTKVISFADAKSKGLKRYYTGVPCKWGHLSERLISNRGCLVCADDRHHNWRVATGQRPGLKFMVCVVCGRGFRRLRSECYCSPNCKKENLKVLRRNRRTANKEKILQYKRNGPKNPIGETQWLLKSRAMLRHVKRALRSSNPHEALLSLSKELQQGSSSQR